jgi:hypothetical protein
MTAGVLLVIMVVIALLLGAFVFGAISRVFAGIGLTREQQSAYVPSLFPTTTDRALAAAGAASGP